MSRGSFRTSTEKPMALSPAFLNCLPQHSAGEFLKAHFTDYGEYALRINKENFMEVQQLFYGDMHVANGTKISSIVLTLANPEECRH